ncbi:MAG: RuBisCO large subunit C-terminal-like domain-containing protein [Pseudomonadota bacterium]
MLAKNDIAGFFAEPENLDLEQYIIQTYYFETTANPELAAAGLASEQSTAQWKRPQVAEDLRKKFGAKVIGLDVLEVSDQPHVLTSFTQAEKYSRCVARLAHPIQNFGTKIPNLLTAVCGEGAFHAPEITYIKLMDLGFPQSFLADFQGPQFGLQGLKKILQAEDRPIFMGVVKPNIGLPAQDFADIAYQSLLGGLDIAKDDEMQADCANSPLIERAKLMKQKVAEAAQKTGEPKIFLANITDEVDRLLELHDLAVENGAGAVMVNSMTVGLSALRMLRKHATVPIVGHFDFIAPFARLSFFGVSQLVINKLQRLTGCDAIIMPGFGRRMLVEEEEVKANAQACLATMGEVKRTLPIPGGSDWAGTLPVLYEKLRTLDFGFVLGRGVFDHPQGAAAGARSIRQAWQAIVNRLSLQEFAKDHVELRQAIEVFGKGISHDEKTNFYHQLDADRVDFFKGTS